MTMMVPPNVMVVMGTLDSNFCVESTKVTKLVIWSELLALLDENYSIYPMDCANFSKRCVSIFDFDSSFSRNVLSKNSLVLESVSFTRITVLSSVACSFKWVKCFLNAGSAPTPIFMTSPKTSVSNWEQTLRMTLICWENSSRALSRFTDPKANSS